MTSSLQDLVESSFQLMYYMKMQPSEVDKLTTYEMREYMNLLRKALKRDGENDTSLIKAFLGLFSSKR